MKKTPSKHRQLRAEEKALKKARFILTGVSILFAVLTLLSLAPAMAAINMFDAHGATENPATILLFLCFFSLPAVLLCSILLSWLFYVLTNLKKAYLVLLFPLINVIGAGIGLAWLQIAYDGLFSGRP